MILYFPKVAPMRGSTGLPSAAGEGGALGGEPGCVTIGHHRRWLKFGQSAVHRNRALRCHRPPAQVRARAHKSQPPPHCPHPAQLPATCARGTAAPMPLPNNLRSGTPAPFSCFNRLRSGTPQRFFGGKPAEWLYHSDFFRGKPAEWLHHSDFFRGKPAESLHRIVFFRGKPAESLHRCDFLGGNRRSGAPAWFSFSETLRGGAPASVGRFCAGAGLVGVLGIFGEQSRRGALAKRSQGGGAEGVKWLNAADTPLRGPEGLLAVGFLPWVGGVHRIDRRGLAWCHLGDVTGRKDSVCWEAPDDDRGAHRSDRVRRAV